jgi:hypothetical protein
MYPARAIGRLVDSRIVHQHQMIVAGAVNVELEDVDAQFYCPIEREDGLRRPLAIAALMRDHFWTVFESLEEWMIGATTRLRLVFRRPVLRVLVIPFAMVDEVKTAEYFRNVRLA